eukprot:scaffold10908_cov33-Prasinocladus_malaysianus.AAC.1
MASSSKFSDLLDYIDWSSIECLNQSPDRDLANAIKQGYRDDDGLFLESDTDEQLLLYVPFNQSKLIAACHASSAHCAKHLAIYIDGRDGSRCKAWIHCFEVI